MEIVLTDLLRGDALRLLVIVKRAGRKYYARYLLPTSPPQQDKWERITRQDYLYLITTEMLARR